MKDEAWRSDTQLLLEARSCAEPFGVFYERYFASVLAFFRRRVAGPEEAFDLAAESSPPRSPQCLASGPGRSRLRPGCLRSHATVERGIASESGSGRGAAAACDGADRAGRGGDRDHRDDALAPAVELLENLAPAQREAIEAHHLDGRGYAEIAADLCCSESVVRKRVSRGLAALHAQLDQGRTL